MDPMMEQQKAEQKEPPMDALKDEPKALQLALHLASQMVELMALLKVPPMDTQTAQQMVQWKDALKEPLMDAMKVAPMAALMVQWKVPLLDSMLVPLMVESMAMTMEQSKDQTMVEY